MPFDSFMTRALTCELAQNLTGLKVDKICQPERDEIDLLFHLGKRSRLVINCTASTPYMALSDQGKENPSVPPNMCMLLRKHLSRARIVSVRQLGFDRIIRIAFESTGELGFSKTKYLFCEMMGRGSNLIFADDDQTILASFRQNDITTKFDRVIMVGVRYSPMPLLDKIDPTQCEKERFLHVFTSSPPESRADLVLQKHFLGFGKLTAREIVYRAGGDPEKSVCDLSLDSLWSAFSHVLKDLEEERFSPCVIYASREAMEKGESPLDFSFMEISQFGQACFILPCESVSEAIEKYYSQRDLSERRRQHYNDIARILKNCRQRLEKKIALQKIQLAEASHAEEDKRCGDLITQELYRVRRGDAYVVATDYSKDVPEEVTVMLDPMLSPSQNAQRYYREYAKKKTTLTKVREQIEIAKEELKYADGISSSLDRAATSADLAEIREEISHWNYGRRLSAGLKKSKNRKEKPKPRKTLSPNGFEIFVGMNHYQNDTICTHLAGKDDLWFHVKNYHGSHVLLKSKSDMAFENEDLEYAASLAAYYSEEKNSTRVEVDFTLARFLKKPTGSRPGYVTYKNQSTVIVSPKSMN